MPKPNVCLAVLLLGAMLSTIGCIAPGHNAQEKRDNIQKMKEETMASFYRDKPELRQMVKSAAGYAVFKNFAMGLIPGGGSGYGVLVDNASGQQTYMQMGQFSLGLILMVKDWRMLVLFDDRAVMREFATENWRVGATAEAVFNFGTFGAQTNASADLGHSVRIYELTENGVSLRAYIPLIKFSPYNQLNTTMMLK